jgi:transposase
MTLHQNVLGVDAAKDWIDTYDLASGGIRRIETTSRALKAFAQALPRCGLVVFEASGGYERPLMAALEDEGLVYARVNPRQARDFARATGRLAKTDKVDARVLAEMGKALNLKPTPPADPARRRLAELVARRTDLVGMITAETNRLAQAADTFVRRSISTLLSLLERRKLVLDKEIENQVRAATQLAAHSKRLRTAPGVGPGVAATILAFLPELGTIESRPIASLAGLAPHARDSGHNHGRRKIWGGRPQVRRALYIAAFVASRRDPELKAMRERLTNAGKPFKVAIIAVARKLLTILNAMIREDRDYRQKPKT